MEKNNVLVPMLAQLQAKGEVTDSDWNRAESQFRMLGCAWVSDLAEESEAFRQIMKAHTNGFDDGYW